MIGYNKASVLGYQESGVVGMVPMSDNAEHGGYGGDDDGLTCQDGTECWFRLTDRRDASQLAR
jgi:hypothetical protein